ncbi:MORN repeat-containing protein [Paenibacillus lutrae]|uniref:Membrane-binding protein n=1 Tax=Paenibacillus lutrae TaxID=2078573 RepID=A0A7X3FJQ9_9BACL|nr:membrane-binding protein [Paenibacillus lutrae]MVP00956.1 membrane-binding protein [Paenibacillus lutrae]
MKKLVYGLAMMLALFLLPLAASAASITQVQVNSKTIGLSAEPQISGDTAYADLNSVLGSLGYTVQNNVYGSGYLASKDGSNIQLVPGSSSFIVNGETKEAGASVVSSGSTPQLNLKAFANLTGRQLKVNSEAGLISLNDTLQTSVLETLYTGTLTNDTSSKSRAALNSTGYTGFITIYYPDGKKFYEGDMVNSKFEGNGKYYDCFGTLRYDGKWKDNKFDGNGKSYHEDSHPEYDGKWKAGLKQGYGVYNWTWEPCAGIPDNVSGYNKYTGFFNNDEFNGVGRIKWADGSRFEGNFVNGVIQCGGTFHWTDGWKYIGMYKDGLRHGYGTEYDPDGNIIYEGEFKNSVAEGYGRLYDCDGNLVYEGEFVNGQPAGSVNSVSATDLEEHAQPEFEKTLAEKQ